MRRYYLLLLIITTVFLGNAQNLVVNPGFEEYTRLPHSIVNFSFIKDWKGEGIYFNKKSRIYSYETDVAIPKNYLGSQQTHSGDAYASISFFYNVNDVKGFFVGKLDSTLQKDSIYYIETFVSLSDNYQYAINNVGIKFIETNDISTIKSIDGFQQADVILSDTFVTSTEEWIKISSFYKAKGNEKAFIFGTFGAFDIKKLVNYNNNIIVARYYVDDFYIGKDKEKFDTIKTFIFNNVLFDENIDSLSLNSYSSLSKVVNYLQIFPDKNINILGYTDNIGNQTYNLQLSLNRAKNVADYFIFKGIDKNRISYKGLGEANPVASNDTEEGRMKNRRIEIEIE